jgi:hypothetical protein
MPFNGVFPAVNTEISPFGLLSVADVTEHSTADSHWINGFQYETENCGFNASIQPICAPGDPDIELFDNSDGPNYLGNIPFSIKVEDTCLAVGWDVADRKAKALRKLDLVTQKALETELSTGFHAKLYGGSIGSGETHSTAEQQYLANQDTVQVLGNGSTSLGVGLALLEQALADCGAGSRGVIHVPRDVASLLDTHVQPDSDGKQLLTKNNHNWVISGSGYTGAGPGDESRDQRLTPWIYATGPIVVHLGAPEVITPRLADQVNARTNEMTVVAVKPAAVYWDGCCHFGIQVDLSLCGCEQGDFTDTPG